MRFDRDKLIFLALCVLNEVCWRTQRGVVEGNFSIRLALATLHALGDGNKQPFYNFWTQMRNPCDSANSWSQANTIRHGYVFRALNQVARSVGVDLSIDYCNRLAKARRGRSGSEEVHS